MNKAPTYVVGIHDEYSHTEAIVLNREGQVVALTEVRSDIGKIQEPSGRKAHFHEVIQSAIAQAGCRPEGIGCLVAGIAGLEWLPNHEAVTAFTAVEGLACPHIHVDSTVTASAGALGLSPGIAQISWGMVAMNPMGHSVSSHQFGHSVQTNAYYLGQVTLGEMICGFFEEADQEFVRDTLAFFEVTAPEELRTIVQYKLFEPNEPNVRLPEMGKRLLLAAEQGVPLAQRICVETVDNIMMTIRLLVRFLEGMNVIPVALLPQLSHSYICGLVEDRLRDRDNPAFSLVKAQYSALGGAALIALSEAGESIDDNIRARLQAHPKTAYTPLDQS